MKKTNQQIDPQLVLKVENLSKKYQLGDHSIHALNKIELKVKKGEFIAIVGASGSGKTTLINNLGALDFPDRGNVIYNTDNKGIGNDITKMNDKQQKNMRLLKIGFIFQFYNLFPILTAYENVALPMIIAKTKPAEIKRKVPELLDMVGLKNRMNHLPTQLSGGEQQRVTIARCLANDPSIILADEPTGELDTQTTLQILRIFLKMKEKGHSILMVTHNSSISKVADRIITLKDGCIISENKGGNGIDNIFV